MRNILALALLACLPMTAEMTVKQYQKDVNSSDYQTSHAAKLFVMGMGVGISWANTVAAEKKNPPLYCVPPQFSMNGDNFVDILDKMIKAAEAKMSAKELNDSPVGMLLVMGLQESFPCEGAK